MSVACSDADTGSREPVTLEEFQRIAETRLSPDEQVLIMNAINGVVEACMQQAGYAFDYPTATVRAVFGRADPVRREHIWIFGSSRSGTPTEEGYGLARDVQARSEDLAAAVQFSQIGRSSLPDLSSFSPEELERFDADLSGGESALVRVVLPNGETEEMYGGGCLGKGISAVYGSVSDYLRINGARSAALNGVWTAALADPDVVAALDAWKACMATAGFQYENPPALLSDVARQVAAGNTTYEVDVAALDLECRATSQLSDEFIEAFESATADVLAQLEGLLLAAFEFEHEALSRALALVHTE